MWEYKITGFGAHEMLPYKINQYLDNEGKERWELVQIDTNYMINDPSEVSNYRFYFKRKAR